MTTVAQLAHRAAEIAAELEELASLRQQQAPVDSEIVMLLAEQGMVKSKIEWLISQGLERWETTGKRPWHALRRTGRAPGR